MSYIDDFISNAEADNREGHRTVMVTDNTPKTWDDGGTNANLSLTILEAPGSKLFCNLMSGPLPSEEMLEAVAESGDSRKIRGTSFGLRLRKQLKEHYGVEDPATIAQGDQFCAKLEKDKKTGYIKVRAFLSKGAATKTEAAAAADSTPF